MPNRNRPRMWACDFDTVSNQFEKFEKNHSLNVFSQFGSRTNVEYVNYFDDDGFGMPHLFLAMHEVGKVKFPAENATLREKR
jgi:hypothetical protein